MWSLLIERQRCQHLSKLLVMCVMMHAHAALCVPPPRSADRGWLDAEQYEHV